MIQSTGLLRTLEWKTIKLKKWKLHSNKNLLDFQILQRAECMIPIFLSTTILTNMFMYPNAFISYNRR